MVATCQMGKKKRKRRKSHLEATTVFDFEAKKRRILKHLRPVPPRDDDAAAVVVIAVCIPGRPDKTASQNQTN